jgi:transporter family-2 protein
MSRSLAVICTLGAGALVGLQPPANSALARHVGDFGAAFVSTAISVTIIGVLMLAFGHPGRLAGLSEMRPEYALGGIGGAAVVALALVAVRPLGAGAVVALLVAAQLIVSVAADHLGWFGLHHVRLDVARLAGVLLVVAGTVLVTRH